jgi:hypothetical protein
MTGPSIREFEESPAEQGQDERIARRIDTTKWPGTGGVTNVVNVLKDKDGVDVSGTKLAGSPTVNVEEITTSLVIGLVPGEFYRFEVKWDKGGNTYEAWGILQGKL